MLDCQIFGLNSGLHHTTNLILHIINTLLLFYLLKQNTGALWRSALVASLFALHPLNVESVAWIAARKNVLSTSFWILTLLAYSSYAAKPGKTRYLLTFFSFVLGLMAKPMLVTLPFVFLLWDYWPLDRLKLFDSSHIPAKESVAKANSQLTILKRISIFESQTLSNSTLLGLLVEKFPFFIFSGISIYLSSFSAQNLGLAAEMVPASIPLRIANALVSYFRYLEKTIWPMNLTFHYPFPAGIPLWQTVAAGFLLVLISGLIIVRGRRYPYLPVGWLWYIGTLVPVIGLVQAGFWPAMADRWVYIPLIGIFVVMAWGVPELLAGWRYSQTGLSIAAALMVSFFMVTATLQVKHWKNSTRLFKHALDVTDKNALVYNNLGNVLYRQGLIDESIRHYTEALAIYPRYELAHNNLGAALIRQGHIDAAIYHFQKAVEIKPDFRQANNNLKNTLSHKLFKQGVQYQKEGQLEKAIDRFQKALKIKHGYVRAIEHLAAVYLTKRDYKTALPLYKKVLALQTDNVEACYRLAVIYAVQHRVAESVIWLKQAVERGFSDWQLLKTDKDLENIRTHTYYRELIEGK